MNRYVRPIAFAFEPDVVSIFAKVTFGASGAPTLDTNNSKGLCSFLLNTISFTGTTANASPTVSVVSSFAGLYKGMTVQDSGPTNVNQAISSFNAGGSTITLGGNATGTNTGLTATGGQYILQLGQQAGVRLDAYNKLLDFSYVWDQTTAQGSASVLALAPNAPSIFIVGNTTSVRTIPGTATSAATDCTLKLQMGSGSGTSFAAAVPNNGDVLRFWIALCRSSAI